MIESLLSIFNFSFTSAEGIFSYIAITATIFALFITIFAFIFDGDSDADPGAEGDLGAFSLRSIVGFFLGFGWGGLVSLNHGASLAIAVIIALLAGTVMFMAIVLIMKLIYSLRSDGTLKYDTLVGMNGIVYVTIPPNNATGGQVKVAHPSQLFYLPAVQNGDTPLPVNTPVTIVSVTSGILTVAPPQ